MTKDSGVLRSTFRHLKGIGEKRERDLWNKGVICWDDLESRQRYEQLPLLTGFSTNSIRNTLIPSRQALEKEDADFFAGKLPRREHYRIALTFPARTLFLDIETTGLSRYYHYITMVGWCMGGKYDFHLRGDDEDALRMALSEAKAVVTFNGLLFDIPFLNREFRGLNIPSAHIDLRFFARQAGLSGGQKSIETSLGISRSAELAELNGRIAPSLWYRYCRGDLTALSTLIEYNYADIVGLQKILDIVLEDLAQTDRIPPHPRPIFRFSDEVCELRLDQEDSRDGKARILPYTGDPAVSLRNLAPSLDIGSLRFVGIDLTGSASRPSGWCLLDGDTAYTKMINSDAELVKSVLEVKPILASIDSPLSLPRGRISVSDDDPGRDTYGITRHCERVLKKRGVNVYPSLIKSMQSLTARGIRLARSFRGLGIPVIESFPGAAQDIMGIPRKRTDLDLLKQGLADFGIKGDYLAGSVRHDELDAITSAIVGFFFWTGQFEALGNDDEDYLIIPDLSISATGWGHRTIIGLSGPIATGKTTAGEFLESLGFQYTRFSLVLGQILRNRGVKPDRMRLQQFGEEVNKNPGQRWLCRQLVQSLGKNGNVVIDGLRHPEDHAFMVEAFGPDFTHVYIDSETEDRLGRYINNGRTEREFLEAECHPVESNVSKLASLAHLVIVNSGGLEEFTAAVSGIVDQLGDRGGHLSCQ